MNAGSTNKVEYIDDPVAQLCSDGRERPISSTVSRGAWRSLDARSYVITLSTANASAARSSSRRRRACCDGSRFTHELVEAAWVCAACLRPAILHIFLHKTPARAAALCSPREETERDVARTVPSRSRARAPCITPAYAVQNDSRSIPQCQLHLLAVQSQLCDIVLR